MTEVNYGYIRDFIFFTSSFPNYVLCLRNAWLKFLITKPISLWCFYIFMHNTKPHLAYKFYNLIFAYWPRYIPVAPSKKFGQESQHVVGVSFKCLPLVVWKSYEVSLIVQVST